MGGWVDECVGVWVDGWMLVVAWVPAPGADGVVCTCVWDSWVGVVVAVEYLPMVRRHGSG